MYVNKSTWIGILDKKKYPEFWSLCRTTTYGLLGGTALGVFGGTCQAVIN